MKLNPLIPGYLVKRYKRFFVDVRLESGEIVTAHSNNTGSMRSLLDTDNRVWIEHVDDPKRKLKYTLHLIQLPTGALVSVNTQFPNRLVYEAIESGQLSEFPQYDLLKREVPYGAERSRIDVYLENNGQATYVEVKNVTLVEDTEPGVAQFPDATTTRGQKHLRELIIEVEKGNRSVMFYLISRADCTHFKAAEHIDPAYATLLEEAVQKGVEVLAYGLQFHNLAKAPEIQLGPKIEMVPFSKK